MNGIKKWAHRRMEPADTQIKFDLDKNEQQKQQKWI